jgi:hypothetical protein
VQLLGLPDVGAVYLHRHTEAIGNTWAAHEKEFSEFVAQHTVHPVEIIDRTSMNSRTLTNPSFRVSAKGTLVHSHAIEHWRQPRATFQEIAKYMLPGSRMIFSVPAMDIQLAQGIFSTLNFEHSYHLSKWAIHELLLSTGFSVIHAEKFADHSIFFACERTDIVVDKPSSVTISESKKLVLEALAIQRERVTHIAEALSGFDGPVYLFGAHIFSQYLLEFGLAEDLFSGVLDNSKIKAGNRMYGTDLPIIHPDGIRKDKRVMVVLHTGTYDSEIRQGLRNKLGENVVFC